MSKMNMTNRMACDFLTAKGFPGHFFKTELKKLVTVQNSMEQIEPFAKVSMHGVVVAVTTGGDHFMSDYMFMEAELPAKKTKMAHFKGGGR